jgi:hypothetical protein
LKVTPFGFLWCSTGVSAGTDDQSLKILEDRGFAAHLSLRQGGLERFDQITVPQNIAER